MRRVRYRCRPDETPSVGRNLLERQAAGERLYAAGSGGPFTRHSLRAWRDEVQRGAGARHDPRPPAASSVQGGLANHWAPNQPHPFQAILTPPVPPTRRQTGAPPMLRNILTSVLAITLSAAGLFAFDAVGTIKKVDAENGVLYIHANGQDRTVTIDKGVKVLGADGKP